MQQKIRICGINSVDKIDAKMCDTLKQLYKVFEAACQGQEKVSLKLSRFF